MLRFSKIEGMQVGSSLVNCTKSLKASHLFQYFPASMLLHAAEYQESWKQIWSIGTERVKIILVMTVKHQAKTMSFVLCKSNSFQYACNNNCFHSKFSIIFVAQLCDSSNCLTFFKFFSQDCRTKNQIFSNLTSLICKSCNVLS